MIAFVVAVGTLLIQGATMPALIRALNVADPYERLYTEEQLELARTISTTAARQHLAELGANPPAGVDADDLQSILDRVNRSMQARAEAQQVEDAGERDPSVLQAAALFETLRRSVLRAQRQALIAARDDGDLDDETLRTVLEGLDIEEAAAEERINRRRR